LSLSLARSRSGVMPKILPGAGNRTTQNCSIRFSSFCGLRLSAAECGRLGNASNENCAKLLSISKAQIFVCDPFEFEKRSQDFIRVHNETLSVAAMRISNEDRSPVGINR